MKKLYALVIGILIALNCANVWACDACGKGKKKKKHKTSQVYVETSERNKNEVFNSLASEAQRGEAPRYAVAQVPAKPPAAAPKTLTPEVTPANPIYIDALNVLKNPKAFLNKPVFIKAKFDKFSTLGLDYPPINRPSSDYITFLVQRGDTPNHDIPLSEVKFFMKRSYAEKFIDLETGDIVNIHGRMFSNALSDVWIDVDKIDIKEKVKKTDK